MVTPLPGGRRRVDRVLAPDFLEDLTELPIADVRAKRQDAMQEEADLSYVRRMLQGRIEILEQEIDVRAEETDEALVARLTTALVGNTMTPASSSRHLITEPSRISERRRYVERLIADVGLSDAGQLTRQEAGQAVERLRETERTVSRIRADVHGVIDALTEELGRRYRVGEAGG